MDTNKYIIYRLDLLIMLNKYFNKLLYDFSQDKNSIETDIITTILFFQSSLIKDIELHKDEVIDVLNEEKIPFHELLDLYNRQKWICSLGHEHTNCSGRIFKKVE